jgi:hypothetical protein
MNVSRDRNMGTTLDEILNQIRQASEVETQKRLLLKDFKKCLLEILPEKKGKGPDFSRLPKDGKDGELWFRNKLLWLRTIPLEDNKAFIALHAETGGYYQGNGGKFSADLLGVWHNSMTTQFAVAELKAGKRGDPIFYAVAEGLRNVYLHWQEIERLSCLWRKWIKKCIKEKPPTMRYSVWRDGNPFSKLNQKNIHLLVIGDHSWIKNQISCIKEVPSQIQFEKVRVNISVYSLNKRCRTKSKPYALLPMEKHP